MSRAAFDEQAAEFDRRAGLPDAAVVAIGRHLERLAEGGRIVEIGCGTGQVGAALVSDGARYVGLDLSTGMLARFGRRSRAPRVAADASRPWPLRGDAAQLIFASRAAHRLDLHNLAGEVARLASPSGGRFAIGRVERPQESVRTTLRRELEVLLAARGLPARGGRKGHRAVLEALVAHVPNTTELPAVVVARWETEERPAALLDAWAGKTGLGGHDVTPQLQREVLSALRAFAEERFGALDVRYPSIETYEIAGVSIPPRGDRA